MKSRGVVILVWSSWIKRTSVHVVWFVFCTIKRLAAEEIKAVS